MIVHLRLFAVARQLAGSDQLELELPTGATIGDLRRALLARVPALAPMAGHLLFAVDAEYASDATALSATSDVACIPPVSGG